MMLYRLSSSCCVWVPVPFCVRMFSRIDLVSFTGMVEYKFEMTSEARLY